MQQDIKTQSVTLSILVIASLVVGYFVFVPGWKKLSATRMEFAAAMAEQDRLAKAHSDLESFLNRFYSLTSEAEIAARALPAEPQPAAFLASIEQLAASSGVALSTMNVIDPSSSPQGSATASNSIMPYEVQIVGASSYFSFKDFLIRLERHLRIIDVQNINFGVDESNNLEFEFLIRTYYQR